MAFRDFAQCPAEITNLYSALTFARDLATQLRNNLNPGSPSYAADHTTLARASAVFSKACNEWLNNSPHDFNLEKELAPND